jgi:parallel beta-helix repeat protein
MTKRLALIALSAIAVPHVAGAAPTCADRTPAPITAAAPAGRKCQDAIAKAGAKFLGSKIKTLAKCKAKQPAGACPLATDTLKIEKAAAGAATMIAKACGDDAAQAGLTSSYGAGTDDAVISSCMLSQHNVVGGLIVAESNGADTAAWPGTAPGTEKSRASCVKELNKQGTKFLKGALKATQKCLSAQAKAGAVGDLSPVCVGSFSGGSFTAPTDLKASASLAKLFMKTDLSISKKCGPAETLGQIDSIFACPGSSTVADLQKCIECGGMNGTFDAVEQEYAESGTFVANGVGALQTAVSAASPGDKLLIGSGTYQEEVIVTADNLSIVGCGGATDDRPRVIPPVTQVTGRGFQAVGVDGLTFQSLDFFDQNSDHIFVANAQGVTFRDITGDGNRNTRYAVFPVNSNDVVVELCNVVQQDDAPIYVGQSSTIVVRYNEVRLGVAGIEIENCGNAQVYGNYGAGNTAGLMVFKDNDLPVQLAECHRVHHNVFENNNEPNFGMGTVAGVPTGTGMLVISVDSSTFDYNMLTGNNTTGITLTTQDLAGFTPPSEQIIEDNYVFNNVLLNNGTSPDYPARWPLPFGVDLGFIPSSFALTTGNCEKDNIFDTELGFAGFATPPNVGECTLPPPAFLPGCPAPPIGATTTTTTSSTTTTTMMGSPSPAFVAG